MQWRIVMSFLMLFTQGVYGLEHLKSKELELEITKSLIPATQRKDLEVADVMAVQDRFYALPRWEMTHEELRDIKYLMQHWREQLKFKLMTQLEALPSDEALDSKRLEVLSMLMQLDIFINNRDLNDIQDMLKSYTSNENIKDRFQLLKESQGEPLEKKLFGISGPSTTLPIKPVDPSPWSLEKWSQDERFTHYYRDFLDRAFYRGHFFENGDIVVLNQNNNMEGTFSVFMQGPQTTTHAGIYVDVEIKGKKFPAIFEIYNQGTRFVPLSIFLSPNFTSYAEVYRVNHEDIIDTKWQKALSKLALKMYKRPHGYNFFGDFKHTKKGRYITCTQLVQMLLMKVGALKWKDMTPCGIKKEATPLIRRLGFTTNTFLTPTSFIRNPHLHLVGVFDSGDLKNNLFKELVLTRLNEAINRNNFNFEDMSQELLFKATELYLIYAPEFIKNTILMVAGNFTKESIPIGPTGILSLILPLDMKTAHAISQVRQRLSTAVAEIVAISKPFSFTDFKENPVIKQEIDDIFIGIEKPDFFKDLKEEDLYNLDYTHIGSLEQ